MCPVVVGEVEAPEVGGLSIATAATAPADAGAGSVPSLLLLGNAGTLRWVE